MTQVSSKASRSSASRAAALRLCELMKPGEGPTAFARRLGIGPSHVSNWTSDEVKGGLSLEILARVAPRLTDAEVVYVVAGRKLESRDSEDAAYAQGIREALGAIKVAAGEVEERLVTRPPESRAKLADRTAEAVEVARRAAPRGRAGPRPRRAPPGGG